MFRLTFTALGIAWLDPRSSWLAAASAIVAMGVPLTLQRALHERDLRVRAHVGGLGRIYLDALLGLVALRAHRADTSIRREHESLLVEWVHASRARDRIAITAEVISPLLGLLLTGWIFLSYYARAGEPAAALLLLYWGFTLPLHGQALSAALRQLPTQRNVTLRLTEPLGAIEQESEAPPSAAISRTVVSAQGAAFRFDHVTVRAGGHTILDDVDLTVPAGAHVAIVGASGAGKSSLVGILLGWHRASSGDVFVDGERLAGAKLDAIRAETAWIDPSIQLWNQPLIDNLVYGASAESAGRVGEAVQTADLETLLETLPEGLATKLGEGGGLVSGGEGQRVRFARATLRSRDCSSRALSFRTRTWWSSTRASRHWTRAHSAEPCNARRSGRGLCS